MTGNLPRLLTAEMFAKELGIPARSVRTLREQNKISAIMVSGTWMYPRETIDEFIEQNVRKSCQGQTEAHISNTSKSEENIISAGPKRVGRGNEARGQRIIKKLKNSSQNSLNPSSNVSDLSLRRNI
ncbi:helix-turn-helix domain-containing protein [Sneathiella sp. HT1-7]|uniref:helix-turn-helix domain-containing protein n=1 Tax=Sneathiella sp. HT1-7 TaxID=2887192 RepID=UPI001D156207|nr:helix-turn-helix domain-containing protein [Sneathiella sp. HT1-7]MCC3303830.1 helix-turn-helix domain-containing protein [Sneathiella sp. HT1-7]